MSTNITIAGENLIARKQGNKLVLDVARFIFANIPGLDTSAEVDRTQAKPAASRIVHTYTIPSANRGYVNPNQVVYSAQLGADIGDWDFNWIGLETADNVLFAVAYVPLQQKRKNILPAQVGNNLTRNFMVAFTGAQSLTGVTIDAKTWQHDFTARLKGIDERERLANRDVFGAACFFANSLQLVKSGSVYQLNPGLAYVEGIRVSQTGALPVAVASLPATAWLEVSLQRQGSELVTVQSVVFGTTKTSYTDSAGATYFYAPLAEISSAGVVTDKRVVQAITDSLIEAIVLRSGDYPNLRARATTKDDVGLGNLPNAKSDDPASNSSQILATTAALWALRDSLDTNTTAMIAGFMLSSAPAGWLKANGAAVSRTTYSALFARLGTRYGSGNGSTTFNLPDARANFLRGVDDGRGLDPGRTVGSEQLDMLASHGHGASSAGSGSHGHSATASMGGSGEHAHSAPRAENNDVGAGSPNFTTANGLAGTTATTNLSGDHTHTVSVTIDNTGDHTHAITVDKTGGDETRPRNLAVLYCIKY